VAENLCSIEYDLVGTFVIGQSSSDNTVCSTGHLAALIQVQM